MGLAKHSTRVHVSLSVHAPLLTTSTLGSVEYYHCYHYIAYTNGKGMTRIQNEKQNLNYKQLSQSYVHSLHLD